ncbi:hypothetical protein QFZ68_005981 [Streptomyces sp. V1I6]|nr:hypothetical protein [Streptomyces sp. V1I6]
MPSSPCSKAQAPNASIGPSNVLPRAVSSYSTRGGASAWTVRLTGVCTRQRASVRWCWRTAVRRGGGRRQGAPGGAERESPARLCQSGRARLPATDGRRPVGGGPPRRGGTGCAGRQGVQPLSRRRVADDPAGLRRSAPRSSGLRERRGSAHTGVRAGAGCGLRAGGRRRAGTRRTAGGDRRAVHRTVGGSRRREAVGDYQGSTAAAAEAGSDGLGADGRRWCWAGTALWLPRWKGRGPGRNGWWSEAGWWRTSPAASRCRTRRPARLP